MIVMSLEDRADRIRHDSATPVTVQVAADIAADIDAGRLAPDTRMPSQAEQTTQYGVGRAGHPAAGGARAASQARGRPRHRPPRNRPAPRSREGRHRARPGHLRRSEPLDTHRSSPRGAQRSPRHRRGPVGVLLVAKNLRTHAWRPGNPTSRQNRTFTPSAVMHKNTARPTGRLSVTRDCYAVNDAKGPR